MKNRWILCLALLAVAMVPIANADTIISSSGLTAGASISTTGSSFTGSITFTNTSAVDQMMNAFSLQLLQGNGVISGLSVTGLPAGWHYYDGKQSNSGTPCNQTGNENWWCADGFTGTAFAPFELQANDSVKIDFSGSFTGAALTTGNLDLMANGCTTTNYSVSVSSKGVPSVDCTDGKWAYSAVIGGDTPPPPPPPPPPPVPEPASLALLGSGMTALAHFMRRRK